MNQDCSKIRLCSEHQPPRRINLGADPAPGDIGFLIFRFKVGMLAARE